MKLLTILAMTCLATPGFTQETEVAPQKKLASVPADRAAGHDSINPKDCKSWLSILASDEFGGRGTGRPGYEKAARYVAGKFESWGLEPFGDDGTFFQHVPYSITAPVAEKCWLALQDAEGKELHRLEYGKSFAGEIAASTDKELELVVVNAKDGKAFADVELKGKAVLLIDRSDARARGFSRMTMSLYRKSPAAMIVVDDKLAKASPSSLGRVTFDGASGRRRQPRQRPNRYAVTLETATALLKKAGVDAAILESKEDQVLDVPGKIHAHVVVEKKKVFGANVVARLVGSDPQLKDEYIGIGSHLDHIGTNARGVVNNGADDDGSGTTGVLAVARAFTKNGQRPRRSILFMCFSGEEMGLLGSGYYVANPKVPNKQMVAELQMDMIGRNEEKVDRRTGEVTEKPEDNLNSLHLVGTKKLSDELHELCLDVNKRFVGFDFEYDEEGVFSRSDHANFAKKDIPIAFFFTGFHPQYHRPNDTVDRIDFPKLSRVAKLCYLIGFELAQRDTGPKVDRTWADFQKSQSSGRRRR